MGCSSNHKPWTDEEKRQVIALREQKLSMRQIADKLGRPKGSVCGLFFNLRASPEKRKQMRIRFNQIRPATIPSNRPYSYECAVIFRPTEQMLRDRHWRVSAPYRDLTGWLMGDPPIGYSALDAR